LADSESKPLFRLSVSLLAILILTAVAISPAAADEKRVAKYVTAVIDIYGFGPVEITYVKGPCDLWYSSPYPDGENHIVIDSEILFMDLLGDGMKARRNPALPSPGSTRSIDPGIDFPAESFFDVMYEIELTDFLPGDKAFTIGREWSAAAIGLPGKELEQGLIGRILRPAGRAKPGQTGAGRG
jgi:hypothetical protein